tara:strand:+ start:463 stop:915 length:453 start_codon:yes stop_codon:yes gene_type:complete
MMKNTKTDLKIIARRGLNTLSSKILDELYQVYPDSLETIELAQKLRLREKSVSSAIRKIVINGVPIKKIIGENKKVYYRANLKEPISWIIKERDSAKKMLYLIDSMPGNGKMKDKKEINNRIYKEYIDTLNELFDKWTSLKLIEQLDNSD